MAQRQLSYASHYQTCDDDHQFYEISDTSQGISPEMVQSIKDEMNDIISSYAASRQSQNSAIPQQSTQGTSEPTTAQTHNERGLWDRVWDAIQSGFNWCVNTVVSAAKGVWDCVCSFCSWLFG